MTERVRILIVDDEGSIRYFLSEELSQEGYLVLTAASGEEALVLLEKETIDLVLLDLKMGGMTGLQVMEEIERQRLPPAVIVLTAYADLDSAVDAMRLGGCDYLRKPCSIEELRSSVERGLSKRREAIQRQKMIHLIEETARQLKVSPSSGNEKPVPQPRFLEGRGLLLDREQETVTQFGKTLSLTATEFRLLSYLLERPDQTVSYSALATALYGSSGGEWEDRDARQTLSTHLWRLRRKLDRDSAVPYIVNVRGRGYKFVSNT